MKIHLNYTDFDGTHTTIEGFCEGKIETGDYEIVDGNRRCETCKSFTEIAGKRCWRSIANVCAPNGFSEWEARDEGVGTDS